MMFPRFQHSIAIFSALIATTLSAPYAAADITAANWVNDTAFNYRVTHMPDMDQRRALLDCDGSIHCVPTCATNLVMYVANHGFPSVAPGPGYWEGNTNYALATSTIDCMGVTMQTSCAGGGTGGDTANAGLADWLAGLPGCDGGLPGSNAFVINEHYDLPGYTTNFINIGKSLCGGRIGSVSYGYYDVLGYFLNTPIVQRDGGHCTTVVKAHRNGNARDFWVRNPASDENPNDLNSQSPFMNDIFDVVDMDVIVMPGATLKTMTSVNYKAGDTSIRLLDSHRSLTPKNGYCFTNTSTGIFGLHPINFANPMSPPSGTFPSPTGTVMFSMDWLDERQEFIVVCAGVGAAPPTLQAIDSLTGQSHQIQVPLPPVLCAVGRRGDVYVCNGNELQMSLYPAAGIGPMQPLPHTAHAMIYDDANDEVVLLSRTDRKLMRFDRDLGGPPTIINVPTSFPIGLTLQIALNPTDGAIWLWSNASPLLFRLTPNGSGGMNVQPLSHPAITSPNGLDFDDDGHLFVSNAGTVIELKQVGTGWQVVPNSMFAGLPGFGQLHISRSRTSFEVGVHDTPQWTKNIDPNLLPVHEQHPDCPADIAPLLNADGIVNLADLLLVINNWGSCPSEIACQADIDENGTVNSADLLRVINGWGVCP